MMRNLIFIAMLVAAAFAAGWFKIQRDGENTIIEINRAEIRNDTRHAIDRGREILDREQQQKDTLFSKTANAWREQTSGETRFSPLAPPNQPLHSTSPDYYGHSPYGNEDGRYPDSSYSNSSYPSTGNGPSFPTPNYVPSYSNQAYAAPQQPSQIYPPLQPPGPYRSETYPAQPAAYPTQPFPTAPPSSFQRY